MAPAPQRSSTVSRPPRPRHRHARAGCIPPRSRFVAIPGVKGRFYCSRGTAKALIQRGGTVPSGQRREEGICPQPAGRDSRLTSLPRRWRAQASGEGPHQAAESRPAAAARGRWCPRLPGGLAARMQPWDGGRGNKESYHHPLPPRPLPRHLPLPLRLLRCQPPALRFPRSPWQDKTSLKKNALGKGEGGRDVQQKRTSPPFLPKAPARWSPRRASRFLPASTQRRQPGHEGSGL